MDSGSGPGFDDEPPPEPRDGWLLVRIHVPELNVYKCLQFPSDKLVWDVKQQVLASLPKALIAFDAVHQCVTTLRKTYDCLNVVTGT
uniref:Uncharacterized protein n=1 Tax=Glossina morsitans morsitans TaxID=37546 RepID=A0A1B0G6J2_GLOMM